MIHTFQYRGHTVTVEIDNSTSPIKHDITIEEAGGVKIHYHIDGFKFTENKKVDADVSYRVISNLGTPFNPSSRLIRILNNDEEWDQLSLLTGIMIGSLTEFDFITRRALNGVLENIDKVASQFPSDEKIFCFRFDDASGTPIQPTVVDAAVLDKKVTISKVDGEGDIEASADGVTWKPVPADFTLAAGEHEIQVRSTTNQVVFKKQVTV